MTVQSVFDKQTADHLTELYEWVQVISDEKRQYVYERLAEMIGLSWARWIPVAERLPEFQGDYPVIVETHGRKLLRTGEWDGSSWYVYHILPRVFVGRVLFWMPLPPPPERE